MDLTEYQKLSRETAIYPNVGNNIIYPVLGLVGEVGETFEKIKELPSKKDILFKDGKLNYNIISDYTPIQEYQDKVKEIQKEFGDSLWYLSQCCSELGLDLNDVYYQEENFWYTKNCGIEDMMILSSKITEVVKKTIRDKNGICDDNDKEKIRNHLSHIFYCLKKVLCDYDTDIEIAAQLNIDKLFSRKERGVIQGSGDNR